MAGNPDNLDSMTSKQPNIVDGKYGLDSSIWFKGNFRDQIKSHKMIDDT